MMPETVHAETGTPSCGELRRKADGLLDRYDATMAEVAAGRMPHDQGRRISHLTAALRELRTQLGRIAFSEAILEETEARAEARGFERGRAERGRHRVPSQRHGAAVIPFKPARNGSFAFALAAVATGAKAAGRQTRRVLTAAPHHATIFAASGLAAAGTATVVVLSFNTSLTPYTTQLPVTQPTAVARAQVTPAQLAPPPVLHLAHHATHAISAQVPVIAASAPSPSAPRTDPAPTAPAGVLEIQTSQVTLRPSTDAGMLEGTVTIEAESGPVTWSASASGPVLLSVGGSYPAPTASGTAEPEQPAGITVSVAAGIPAGTAVITVDGQPVQVTWGTSGAAR